MCGVGDYTSRLHAELDGVDLLHVPIRSAYEKALFEVFRGRDLVHVEYPTEGWGNSILPSFMPLTKRRSRLLLTLHEWSQMNPLRRASILPLVSRADGFIFVSEHERAQFASSAPSGAKRKPTWVIPIGVNLEVPDLSEADILAKREEFTPPPLRVAGEQGLGRTLPALRVAGEPTRGGTLPAQEVAGERGFVLLTHFGFIHAGKQPEKLLETVAALKRRGEHPHLVFIGDFQKDKQAEKDAFVSQIKERGLADNVTMLGFVQDDREAALVMAAADVSISLFNDGLSPRRGSFWYATQHGRPAITTRGEAPEKFGETGKFLKPPHVHFVDVDASGEVIAELVDELPAYRPKELEPIPVPTWQDIAMRHEAVYREMLGRG